MLLFSDALKQFTEWKSLDVKPKSIAGYNLILRQFCLFIKNTEIEKVTLKDVVTWFTLMGGLGWDTNSFIPKAIALRKFFEFFLHQGYKVISPELIPIPSKNYKMPRIASEDNYQKLVASIPKKTNNGKHIRNLAFVNLLWDTGARNGEILSLNVDDLDFERKRAVIRTEKSQGVKPIRVIFWGDETNQNLMRWVKKRKQLQEKSTFKDKDALFVSVTTSKHGERWSIKGSGEALRRISNTAKLPYQNAHSYRHRFGHDLATKGANNSMISSLMGHASLNSSFTYTQLSGSELEDTYRKFKGSDGIVDNTLVEQ
jgi:site-specific recombinase XerD